METDSKQFVSEAEKAQFATDTDESVKASASDTTAGYLDEKVDGTTITVVDDKLAVVSVQGLTVGTSDISNWLSGTERNVQNQFNDLQDILNAVAAGMQFKGKVETYADLTEITSMTNGDLVVVLSDESRTGGRSMYVYSESLGMWDFIGEFTFSDEFVALSDTPSSYVGHDGKVVKVDETNGKVIFSTVDYSELTNKPSSSIASIDQSVQNSHSHTNKSSLDALTVVDGVLHIDGVPYQQTKEYLMAVRSGSSQSGVGSTGDVILFNETVHQNGIPYDESNGIFTLKSGKVYSVRVTFHLTSMSSWTGLAVKRLSDNKNMIPIRYVHSFSSTYTIGSSSNIDIVIAPTTDEDYCINVTGGSDTDYSVTADRNALIIQEI